MGSLWGKVSPLFRELQGDPRFDVDVIALPFRHSSSGNDDYHDDGVVDFLRREEGIEPIVAYDASADRWLDLQLLRPDYIFYSTPYDRQYPQQYRSTITKYFAHLCYVPYYGVLIYKGEVEAITHPPEFFSNLDIAFVATEQERHEMLLASGPNGLLNVERTGAPMLASLLDKRVKTTEVWSFPEDSTRTRILWTPRWRLQEGTSHFLEYCDHLLDFVEGRDDIDFVFRPHPLMLDNLVTAGYFTRSELRELVRRFERTANARIDRLDSYVNTFLTSDVLVTDISSMLVEYFVTGKPIIYTHRTNTFNDLGNRLARGCYWVRNEAELDEAVESIVGGRDRLAPIRQELNESILGSGPNSAAEKIKAVILTHRERGYVHGDDNQAPYGPLSSRRNYESEST